MGHSTGNLLQYESSPYLLQHANNPVHWMPWGDKAFELAEKENKLVLVSIGYSSCHWCHVMEHQSFEDIEVAALMNAHFICIKVDREERPDVDKEYMDAVQLLTGSGGWPLNCFALPDGRPVYGGTYFPKESWISVLGQLKDLYSDKPEQFQEQAKRIKNSVRENDLHLIQVQDNTNTINHRDIIQKIKADFDIEYGGFIGAPKFPMPVNWEYLLHYAAVSGDKSVLAFVEQSLIHIANGGIYDQVGGGFARYSVDELWHAPHFEKMLYDNAQLVSVYVKAYQCTGNVYYKGVVDDCLQFVLRDMKDASGGFYSAYDADSEGVEGKYYVWKKQEVDSILGDDSPLICDYYQVTEEGNWENNENIFHAINTPKAYSTEKSMNLNEFHSRIKKSKEKLLQVRDKRIPPLLDDKILTSWNAMMIVGFIDGYKITGNADYLSTAIKGALFIHEKMTGPSHALFRNYKDGKATIPAFLDDYAHTIEMLISLYEVTLNEKWLQQANNFMEQVIMEFYDESGALFYYSARGYDDRIGRKFEIIDNVMPSSNAVMACNLRFLAYFFNRDDYKRMAENMTGTQVNNLQFIRSFAKWGVLSLMKEFNAFEVVVTGSHAKNLLNELNQYYLPNVLITGSAEFSEMFPFINRYKEDKTLIYICENNSCKLPVENVKEALALLNAKNNR